MEWLNKQMISAERLKIFKWNGMAQNVNIVPAVVLTSFNIKLCMDFNFIRFTLVNFVYSYCIYIVSYTIRKISTQNKVTTTKFRNMPMFTLKTILGMHNERQNLGFRATIAACFVFVKELINM